MAWEWLGPVTTAVVGVAGIAGAILSAVITRRTQVEITRAASANALLAEKRQIYAKFLRITEDVFDAADDMRSLREGVEHLKARIRDMAALTEEERQSLLARIQSLEAQRASVQEGVDTSFMETKRIRAEMFIIAGPELARRAAQASKVLAEYAIGANQREKVVEALYGLAEAMHEDAYPSTNISRGR